MLTYSFIEEEDYLQIKLKGDFDIEGTEIINEELVPKMLTHKNVDIDFEHVPFVDSSGMGLLLSLVHILIEKSTYVTISNIQKDVYEVFELLQIPEILGKEIFR